MKTGKIFILSFILSSAVWFLFSWPLPRHLFSGVPASSHNTARTAPRVMIEGDHLQLMSRFWLTGEMLSGHTPLGQNRYEFNTGDEQFTRAGSYYMPFSLIHIVGSWIGGRAFGYNLAGFISIWGTLFFTWLLVRRYTACAPAAVGAALLGIALPYRWAALCGGSPAGFAMVWVPAILLGLDLAVREGKIKGGLLAGISILFVQLGDLQVYFFSMLALPLWCLIASFNSTTFRWNRPSTCLPLCRALSPAILMTVITIILSVAKKQALAASTSAGRSLGEVALYSPAWQGLFAWHDMGLSSHIFIGYLTPIVLVLGFPALLIKRNMRRIALWTWLLLAVSIIGMIILSWGTRDPLHSHVLLFMRKWIPPYAMIRQPTKIFCLLPSFFAVATALSLGALIALLQKKRARLLCGLLFTVLLMLEYKQHVHANVSLTASTQGAYQAVAREAKKQNRVPHVLIVPLWPGDSAYASLYQHYASLYRIRMVNGYSPAVPLSYRAEIFDRFGSINKGELHDEQLDTLLKRDIQHILFHENAFPEKVSPFPAGFTLKRLLNHPRLRFLQQDGPVWAFSIMTQSETRPEQLADWNSFFPARRWELEKARKKQGRVTEDATAGGTGFITLEHVNDYVQTRPTYMGAAPALRWLLRLRGPGRLALSSLVEGRPHQRESISVDNTAWSWREISLPLTHYGKSALRLTLEAGSVDLDMVLMAAGHWEPPGVGESLAIPAHLFFHAGHTDRERNAVVLLKDRDPMNIVLYGPKLPLDKGTYELKFISSSSAPKGTELGRFNIRHDGHEEDHWVSVYAGQPARCRFVQQEYLPFFLAFLYLRKADMEIDRVTLTRLSPPE